MPVAGLYNAFLPGAGLSEFLEAGQMALLIPIIVFLIPIIAILTSHQQKMARIFAEQNRHQHDPEVAALRQEIQELKQLIHQQAISMDNLATGRLNAPPPNPSVSDRLNVGGY